MRRNIGKCRLPELLRKRGFTQQQIADRAGMPKQQISDYATNRRVMSLLTAKIISETLGCTMDDLYHWH